jgi:hypothetical protein
VRLETDTLTRRMSSRTRALRRANVVAANVGDDVRQSDSVREKANECRRKKGA